MYLLNLARKEGKSKGNKETRRDKMKMLIASGNWKLTKTYWVLALQKMLQNWGHFAKTRLDWPILRVHRHTNIYGISFWNAQNEWINVPNAHILSSCRTGSTEFRKCSFERKVVNFPSSHKNSCLSSPSFHGKTGRFKGRKAIFKGKWFLGGQTFPLRDSFCHPSLKGKSTPNDA